MAVPISGNLEKCKLKNQKEQHRCNEKLRDLIVTEQSSLHNLERERIDLLQQLQINRCKVLRSSMKENMLLRDRMTLMKRDMNMPDRNKANLFERSKGFSQIKIEDDENDKTIFQSLRRSKTHMSMYFDGKPPPFTLTDNDIFVLYPTSEYKRSGSGIVTVAELKHNKKCITLFPKLTKERPHTVCGRTLRSKYPKPKYVTKLEELAKKEFNQYTDGTMHLEERRFQQRQREFLPPQLGHLPVRRRYHSASSDNFQLVLEDSNLKSLPPKNIKVYIPKSIRDERDEEDKKEQKRVMRLKQEHEANHYAAVIGLTAGFLGKEPSSKKMIKRPNLNKEEHIMLSHVTKKLPSFRVAATLVKWLTSSFRKSSAKSNKVSNNRISASVTFLEDNVTSESICGEGENYAVSEICETEEIDVL